VSYPIGTATIASRPRREQAVMEASMEIFDGEDQTFVMTSVVEDPCGLDEADDAVIVTTRRSLSRIAFVAAETAARFLREGLNTIRSPG
jgi:hypothetical protein